MQDRVLLGMLTPSSNTILEPMTAAILAALPEVTAHFARFPVRQIGLSEPAINQFNMDNMLAAARLLADARPHVIGWNGTSSGWLGFDIDGRLCAAITQATGIPACTSVLALNELFALKHVRRFGLLTPYTAELQHAIVSNYRAAGYECVAERHLGISDNFSFSQVSPALLQELIRTVALVKPDAIAVFCTNLRAAHLVDELEREIGIPIFDSVATAVWKALRLAGVDTSRVRGWGSLFEDFA